MNNDGLIQAIIDTFKETLREVVREVLVQELNPKKEKELMTFEETRKFLSISQSCLNNWKSEGRIPSVKIGKRIYFKRQEILAAAKVTGNYKILQDLEKK